MAWTLDQLVHMTQAQLGAVWDQLPPQGCADCADGGPDTLWMGAHLWGNRPGYFQNTEDSYGVVGEWRKLPGIQYDLFHSYYAGKPGFPAQPFQITPIIAGGFTLQFIELVGPIVMAGASAAIGIAAAGAEAGTAASSAAVEVGATEAATTTTTTAIAEGGTAVSDISFDGITAGYDLSAVGGTGFDFGSLGLDASGGLLDAGSTAVDYSSGGFNYEDLTSGADTSTADLYGGAADVSLPTDVPLASVPDITVATDATSALPSWSLSSLTSEARQVLSLISTASSIYKMAEGKQGVPTRVGSQTITPNLNGTITTSGPTGTRTVPMQPGIPYTFPDGTTVVNNGDGTYTTIHPDGSHTTTRYPSTGGLGALFGSAAGSSNLLLYGVGAIALVALLRR